jgi:hypothetical protein
LIKPAAARRKGTRPTPASRYNNSTDDERHTVGHGVGRNYMVHDEGLRMDRRNAPKTPPEEYEETALTDPHDRFSLRSTIGSYEVEEIDGGHLGLWIVRHGIRDSSEATPVSPRR